MAVSILATKLLRNGEQVEVHQTGEQFVVWWVELRPGRKDNLLDHKNFRTRETADRCFARLS